MRKLALILLNELILIFSSAQENVEKDALQQTPEVLQFQRLFQHKREQQKDAVKSIMNYKDQQKAEMVKIVTSKILKVLGKCHVKLRDLGYTPGMEFPKKQETRETVSLLLENTALLSDLLLYVPDETHLELDKDKQNKLFFTWGLFFASHSPFVDASTRKLINLATQELEIAEKDPAFHNPYRKGEDKEKQALPKKTEAKKKKIKRGPRMSGEL